MYGAIIAAVPPVLTFKQTPLFCHNADTRRKLNSAELTGGSKNHCARFQPLTRSLKKGKTPKSGFAVSRSQSIVALYYRFFNLSSAHGTSLRFFRFLLFCRALSAEFSKTFDNAVSNCGGFFSRNITSVTHFSVVITAKYSAFFAEFAFFL